MKPNALTFVIIASLFALASCTTTTQLDPATGKPISKTTVPDPVFTKQLTEAAATAAKQAIDSYTATHQPKSAVAPTATP